MLVQRVIRPSNPANQHTEVHFASSLSGGFITAIHRKGNWQNAPLCNVLYCRLSDLTSQEFSQFKSKFEYNFNHNIVT